MSDLCPVELARELIRIDTSNPPGNEGAIAALIAPILRSAGLTVEIVEMAPGRASIVADLRPNAVGAPRCFTGHLDTVPFVRGDWHTDPLDGAIVNGRLHGRGSSDMKGGVAALVVAAVKAAASDEGPPVRLLLTAGEETGCEGATHLAVSGRLSEASLLIVAEPTSNRVFVAHKGVLWLRLRLAGTSAHGSMPELGDNAVIKAATAIKALDGLGFDLDEPHSLLGRSTVNVGFCKGGANFNVVPAHAEVGLDLRLSPPRDSASLIEMIRNELGSEVGIEELLNLAPVDTNPAHAWVTAIRRLCQRTTGFNGPAAGLPYFTDAAALNAPLGNPPVVIVGPGDPGLAHVANESCDVKEILQATALYLDVMQFPEQDLGLSASPQILNRVY